MRSVDGGEFSSLTREDGAMEDKNIMRGAGFGEMVRDKGGSRGNNQLGLGLGTCIIQEGI